MDSLYSTNPSVEQQSIVDYIKTEFPHIPVITGGLPDQDNDTIQPVDDVIPTFVILWFSNVKKGKKQSFAGNKLGSHYATVDVAVIASNDDRARRFINELSDRLEDFKPAEGGRMSIGTPLFGDGRQIRQEAGKPSRWMRTNRFDFGVASKRIA